MNSLTNLIVLKAPVIVKEDGPEVDNYFFAFLTVPFFNENPNNLEMLKQEIVKKNNDFFIGKPELISSHYIFFNSRLYSAITHLFHYKKVDELPLVSAKVITGIFSSDFEMFRPLFGLMQFDPGVSETLDDLTTLNPNFTLSAYNTCRVCEQLEYGSSNNKDFVGVQNIIKECFYKIDDVVRTYIKDDVVYEDDLRRVKSHKINNPNGSTIYEINSLD